ncbi:MAG: hypothetical protein GY866_16650 [Proteobacteria bacterium]|nr:hypothetical protein [Pseudomonadota bacterium]
MRRGTPSSCLVKEAGSYRLYLGDGGSVDVDAFKLEKERAAAEDDDPEKSMTRYLNAESIYCGDFLEEDRYVDWCAEERANLQAEYLGVLEKKSITTRKNETTRNVSSTQGNTSKRTNTKRTCIGG